MSNPVLDISTIAPIRPTVRLRWSEQPDGKLYELAVFDDISIAHQQFLYSRGDRLQQLMEMSPLGDDERDELELIVDGMVGIVLPDLPEKARGELGGMQKVRIVEAFTMASPELKSRVEALRASPSTTGS